MTKLLVRFARTVWELSGWKELNEFLGKSIAHEEEMLALIIKMKEQRDELIDIANKVIYQRDIALKKLADMSDGHSFILRDVDNKKIH